MRQVNNPLNEEIGDKKLAGPTSIAFGRLLETPMPRSIAQLAL